MLSQTEAHRWPSDASQSKGAGSGPPSLLKAVAPRPAGVGATRLMLTGYRSYRALMLEIDARPVVLVGENGAGKTNLIEALSLLGPGRGLRGAALSEIPHRFMREDAAPAWAVAIQLETADGPLDLGTGTLADGMERRIGRRAGTTVGLSALAEHLRLIWLTPAMDRLFVEGASGRRRFLDRMTLALDPAHAARSSSFERAMRERNRLLRDGPRDPMWLDGLEAEMARHGVAIAQARQRVVRSLEDVLAVPGPFPQPIVALEGPLEAALAAGETAEALTASYAQALARDRGRDEAAGRTLKGPHISDLIVIHGASGQPASLCSTGEQKALLIGLVLAQATLIGRVAPEACPLLLLDEITAHLDARRREALFDALSALGIQAWLTGTDPQAFAAFGGRAQHLHVHRGRIAPL